MEDLKSGDSDRIVPLFLPSDCDEMQKEHIMVAVRTIIRLVDSDAYIGRASWVSSVDTKGVAFQCMSGAVDMALGIAGEEAGFLSMGEAFAHEEFEKVDLDLLDAVAEFINCVNGMFATGISNKMFVDMEPPTFKDEAVTVSGGRLLQLPVYISGNRINLLSAYDGKMSI